MGPADFKKTGAIVISLDFELVWGIRDIYRSNDPYMLRVINERWVVPKILDLFERYDISATWAIVGLMFARTREETELYLPKVKPSYTNVNLDPYAENLGEGEFDDPLHYAHELIQIIKRTKRQEIATHTFSHYYCLEKGQTRESFGADLDSALSIAENYGIKIKSMVFPRNQHNPEYDDILVNRGITSYRGTEMHRAYRVEEPTHRYPDKRLYRLIDSYVDLSGPHLVDWKDIVEKSGLCNIASSRYFRPINRLSESFLSWSLRRIQAAMLEAARFGKLFHIWMHPQDFGLFPSENLSYLNNILDYFRSLSKQYGMVSLTMADAAELAKSMRETS